MSCDIFSPVACLELQTHCEISECLLLSFQLTCFFIVLRVRAFICLNVCPPRLSLKDTQTCSTVSFNKKAQLTLSNPRDVKACKNCSNSTCFVSFHRIPFPQIANAWLHAVGLAMFSQALGLYSCTQFEIRCLPIIKFLV